MWFDDSPETRVGRDRIEELVETGAETVVTGCPFCLRMVTDGVAEPAHGPAVKAVAEVGSTGQSDSSMARVLA